MTDRDALLRLTNAVDAYFAAKGSWSDEAWLAALNELLSALAQAKAQIAESR